MRRFALGQGLSLAACALAFSAAPAAAVPAEIPATTTGPNLLDVEYSADTVRLTPGETSSWDVLVTFVPHLVDELVLDLDTPPNAGSLLMQDLAVQASACSVAFNPSGCPGTTVELLPVIPFTEIAASEATVLRPVTEDLSGPLYVRVNVTLAEDTDVSADHEPATIHLAAVASGVDTPPGTAPERVLDGTVAGQARPGNRSPLAETGATILGYAGLGVAAVIIGLLVSGVARRTSGGAA